MIDLNDAPLQGAITPAESGPTLDEIVEELRERIDEVARELLGPPNKALSSSQQIRVGRKGSVAVELNGNKRGEWFDHEADVGGGPIELIGHSLGVSFGDACNWARERLGHPVRTTRPHDRTPPENWPPKNGGKPPWSEQPVGDEQTLYAGNRTDPPEPSPEDEKRRTRITAILQQCQDASGTATDKYLAGRHITKRPLPPSMQFRPNAERGYGALVALATDEHGTVHAVQQVFVTNDGRKAPLDVVKRTNKLHDHWAQASAVRLPGARPLVLCEGPETALSIWQATGYEVWACLGVANIRHAPIPDGAEVIVARDGDEPGSKADKMMRKTINALRGRGLTVRVAAPPINKDFNDVLVEEGEELVRALIDQADNSERYSNAWRVGLLCTSEGMPRPILTNAIHALRAAPEWQGVLWHNEFATTTIARRTPPWEPQDADWEDQPWADRDDHLTAAWLQREGILVPTSVAGAAVETVARDRSFHPVREYLDSLVWDGVPRIEQWLSAYCRVADKPYVRAVGKRWLISAIARVYQPGCKADCVLIFEGKQGAGKSQALAVLARPWFTDKLSALGSKDSELECSGVWIIEIAELDSLSRAEGSAIKAFMSRAHDRFRPPYGKRVIELPRQCIFAGTVNPEGGYLKDPTGGRRFWPVKVTRAIDVSALKRDRDQLWAEAAHCYRQGHSWWLETREAEKLAAEEQADRFQGDAWETPVREYLENEVHWVDRVFGPPERVLQPRIGPLSQVTTAEILANALDKPTDRWTSADERRVVSILTSLGFRLERPRVNGKRLRLYVRRDENA